MVLSAALSGMGIPLFMQSIRAAITESSSHSVPNKLRKSDKAARELCSASICWTLSYTMRQGKSLSTM
jgi:Tfp pilus assembly protein FimT